MPPEGRRCRTGAKMPVNGAPDELRLNVYARAARDGEDTGKERMNMTEKKVIGLREMKEGRKGRILRVGADGELGRRIRDMGLVPGVEVEVVGHAPLRDPVALRLSGVTLALRNREADYISMEVDA